MATPHTVVPEDLPQLKTLAWNRDVSAPMAGADALALYEREWRHVDETAMTCHERATLDDLIRTHGNGLFMPTGGRMRTVR